MIDEHVVPLRFLAGRLLAGADARKMLSVADVTCRVSRDEDQQVSYVRTRWRDLEEQLASSRVSAVRLADLGWERYRRANGSLCATSVNVEVLLRCLPRSCVRVAAGPP